MNVLLSLRQERDISERDQEDSVPNGADAKENNLNTRESNSTQKNKRMLRLVNQCSEQITRSGCESIIKNESFTCGQSIFNAINGYFVILCDTLG